MAKKRQISEKVRMTVGLMSAVKKSDLLPTQKESINFIIRDYNTIHKMKTEMIKNISETEAELVDLRDMLEHSMMKERNLKAQLYEMENNRDWIQDKKEEMERVVIFHDKKRKELVDMKNNIDTHVLKARKEEQDKYTKSLEDILGNLS